MVLGNTEPIRLVWQGPEAHPWLYGDPFFQELPATGITETLDAIFKDRDIEQLTREHFRGIGL